MPLAANSLIIIVQHSLEFYRGKQHVPSSQPIEHLVGLIQQFIMLPQYSVDEGNQILEVQFLNLLKDPILKKCPPEHENVLSLTLDCFTSACSFKRWNDTDNTFSKNVSLTSLSCLYHFSSDEAVPLHVSQMAFPYYIRTCAELIESFVLEDERQVLCPPPRERILELRLVLKNLLDFPLRKVVIEPWLNEKKDDIAGFFSVLHIKNACVIGNLNAHLVVLLPILSRAVLVRDSSIKNMVSTILGKISTDLLGSNGI